MKVIVKGGPGSGNWMHLGRPGLVGGSAGMGGAGRLGRNVAPKDRAAKAAELRVRREKLKQTITDVCNKLGYDPEKVIYGGSGYNFKVGKDGYTAAAHYDQRYDRIVVFDEAFDRNPYSNSISGYDLSVGVMSHEITHSKFFKFQRQITIDNMEISKIFQENDAKGVPDNQNIIRWDGTFTNPADAAKYPAYELQRWLTETVEVRNVYSTEKANKKIGEQGFSRQTKLRESDGVTDYSKSYWEAFSTTNMTIDRPINETLAEIAKLHTNNDVDGLKQVDPVWAEFYDRFMNATWL
jgi:hypothetical protein